MEHREKPAVLLVDDDGDYYSRIRRAFENHGNETITVHDFQEVQDRVHEDESRRMVILVGERWGALNALLGYIKNSVQHRVIIFVIASKADMKLKTDWLRAGAHHVFDKTGYEFEVYLESVEPKIAAYEFWKLLRELVTKIAQKVIESMVTEVNNSIIWLLLREVSEDHLTGLDNSKGFFHAVVPQLITMRDKGTLRNRRKKHFEHSAALLAIDGDRFKSINDTYGHIVGTEAIKLIARTLYEHVRKADIVCRYGGDEFLIWLPGLTKPQAIPIAKKLQKAVAETELYTTDGRRVPVSISVGIGEMWRFEIGESAEQALTDLISRADEDLYRAKKVRQAS